MRRGPIEIRGEKRTVAEWSRVSGISGRCIRDRLRLGWDPEHAVFAPLTDLAAILRAHRRPTIPLHERFWVKVDRRGQDECWPWKGTRDKDGYGSIREGGHSGKMLRASLVAHRLSGGEEPGPDGQILHRCDFPPCCNPRHLFVGTRFDNMADMKAKGRARNQRTCRREGAS